MIAPVDARRDGSAPPHRAAPIWSELLPAQRRFVALPSGRHPVIVAELEPEVLSYVRTSLLTVPPGSRLPGWVYTAAGQALRLPGTWRLLPRWRAEAATPTGALNGVTAAHGRRVVVLQHSHDPDGRCVALLFDPGSRAPSHAVKIAPSAAREALRREARALADVGRLRSAALEQIVPRAIDLVESDHTAALVTTARPGVPMLVTYHRPGHTSDPRAVQRDLSVVGRWLARVQAATAGPPEPLDIPADTIDSLQRHGDGHPDGERLLDIVAALRRRLRRQQAPTTLVQGDFWPGNVLVDRGQVTGVVDWEHYRPAGSPLRDVARFALGYASYLDRRRNSGRRVRGQRDLADGLDTVRFGLDGSGWFPDLLRRFLGEAQHRFDLPVASGRDAVLAEVAAVAAEATDLGFADAHIRLLLSLGGDRS